VHASKAQPSDSKTQHIVNEQGKKEAWGKAPATDGPASTRSHSVGRQGTPGATPFTRSSSTGRKVVPASILKAKSVSDNAHKGTPESSVSFSKKTHELEIPADGKGRSVSKQRTTNGKQEKADKTEQASKAQAEANASSKKETKHLAASKKETKHLAASKKETNDLKAQLASTRNVPPRKQIPELRPMTETNAERQEKLKRTASALKKKK